MNRVEWVQGKKGSCTEIGPSTFCSFYTPRLSNEVPYLLELPPFLPYLLPTSLYISWLSVVGFHPMDHAMAILVSLFFANLLGI